MIEGFSENRPDKDLAERERRFDELWQKTIDARSDFIDYELPYPKHEFLEYLAHNKPVLLHGSNWTGLDPLEPRLANCRAKKFGNLVGVYATQDDILPLFHAIRDPKKWRGRSSSGYTERQDPGAGLIQKQYDFAAEQRILESNPWGDGVIYILPRDAFEQGTSDDGNPIDEFVSRTPVAPLSRLRVSPQDFPYLNQVATLSEE